MRNCDEANINKVVSAAMRVMRDIQLIIRWSVEAMSPELQELAELRRKIRN
ncbi:MAG: helix-turn-helix domain-containing protein [Ruminococcus sp.]